MHLFDVLGRVFDGFLVRRQHRRVPAEVAVDWHVFGSALGQRSATEDLSVSGARVRSLRAAPVGSPLVIAIATPKGPLQVHGRVVWSSPVQMGVRFNQPFQSLTA